jgi:hypothetical protein
VNGCVAFRAAVAGFGLTAIVERAPAVTVTLAVPDSVPLVAVTEKVPAVVPAVSSPALVIVPPPAATVHVGVTETGLPLSSWPVAVNCCVAPAARLTVAGDTVILTSTPQKVRHSTFVHDAMAVEPSASAAKKRTPRADPDNAAANRERVKSRERQDLRRA